LPGEGFEKESVKITEVEARAMVVQNKRRRRAAFTKLARRKRLPEPIRAPALGKKDVAEIKAALEDYENARGDWSKSR
jgi:hypothetical protein